MLTIYNRELHPIQRSRNLRGIRRYVSRHLITEVCIATCANRWDGANLYVAFDNGATFLTRFADAGVLHGFVRRWRNVYGAPLTINGRPVGVVSKDHPDLVTGSR